ncbi:MAG: DUF3422 domain-containing protein [Alphaproteobacteria bacterium]|jgi:uncharacterized membrane-anchored protein|nr:DUF3422 domain-containing protein [Alphaproteobacteria bacterium]MCK5623736.1 DUF3422 domain-containing protein [Alphaproteobacteria bacterium]
MPEFQEHDLRYSLVNEVHARPFEQLRPPLRASHIAMLHTEPGAMRDHRHVAELCESHGLPVPNEGATHYSADFGAFRLKWEWHSEFATYTFFRGGEFTDPFARPAISRVSEDWLAGLPGELLVAVNIAVEHRDAPERSIGDLGEFLVADSLAGSRMAGGNAVAWTDFRLHEDGFGRILVRDVGLRSRQAGRLVQRLLEIETYRTMALRTLPLAREAGAEITDAAGELNEIAERMPQIEGLEDEKAMLDRLTRLAARLERLASRNSYRFSAAAAYYALVETRVGELREERIEGLQTIDEFMDRRMLPAMRTCQSTATRQDRLAERVARATTLLRTRVDLAMEAQNRDLLRSMDRRARLQLRLQETVEGLSVAAISYYLVGLVGYAAKGVAAAGLPVPVELVTGLSIPVVVLIVWSALQRVRRRLARDDDAAEN